MRWHRATTIDELLKQRHLATNASLTCDGNSVGAEAGNYLGEADRVVPVRVDDR